MGEVQGDIEKYLREGLAPMKPSDEQIASLVERAGIPFIYAATCTAVRYISYDNFRRNPGARLRTILHGSKGQGTTENKEIDQLCTTLLEAAFSDQELGETDRLDIHQVLYTVICAREPLTVNGLSQLMGIKDDDRVRAALRSLWSVLHVDQASEFVATLHASFPDFMFDLARSKMHHCSSQAHNHKLAELCFEQIAGIQLQFNICRLESSYLRDEELSDIRSRVNETISLELFYACRYWADHVKAANCVLRVVNQLREFLSTRLLLWVEVLNLKNQMKVGTECMKSAVEWCKEFDGEQELVDLAHDARRFVEAFASNPVSQSVYTRATRL